jgi:hypothetical protein
MLQAIFDRRFDIAVSALVIERLKKKMFKIELFETLGLRLALLLWINKL